MTPDTRPDWLKDELKYHEYFLVIDATGFDKDRAGRVCRPRPMRSSKITSRTRRSNCFAALLDKDSNRERQLRPTRPVRRKKFCRTRPRRTGRRSSPADGTCCEPRHDLGRPVARGIGQRAIARHDRDAEHAAVGPPGVRVARSQGARASCPHQPLARAVPPAGRELRARCPRSPPTTRDLSLTVAPEAADMPDTALPRRCLHRPPVRRQPGRRLPAGRGPRPPAGCRPSPPR